MIEPRDAAQQEALDRDAENADRDRRDDQRRPVADPQPIQQKPGGERAQHVLRPMREVDDVEEAEDDRQPEAQHRVERAVDQPDEELRKEQGRRRHRDGEPIEHQPTPQPFPSPTFRAERVPERGARRRVRWAIGDRSGIPHLTPTLSAPWGGEGVRAALAILSRDAGKGFWLWPGLTPSPAG